MMIQGKNNTRFKKYFLPSFLVVCFLLSPVITSGYVIDEISNPNGIITNPTVTTETIINGGAPTNGQPPGMVTNLYNIVSPAGGGGTLWQSASYQLQGNQEGSFTALGTNPGYFTWGAGAQLQGPSNSSGSFLGPVQQDGSQTILTAVVVDCGAGVTTYYPTASNPEVTINNGSLINNNCTITYEFEDYGGSGPGGGGPPPPGSTNNGAQFINYIFPNDPFGNPYAPGSDLTMNAGELGWIYVVMRNTGTNQWNSGYSLHNIPGNIWRQSSNPSIYYGNVAIVEHDNNIGGINHPGVPIVAGSGNQDYPFLVAFQAPSVPGDYVFRWQMHQNGIINFGDVTTPLTIHVNGPTPNLKVHVPSVASDPAGSRSATVFRGQPYELSWAPTGGPSSCTSSGTWGNSSRSTSGGSSNRESDAATTGTKTYTLSCTTGAATVAETVTVEVMSPSNICNPLDPGTNQMKGCVFSWDTSLPWPGSPGVGNPGWLLHSSITESVISGTPDSASLIDHNWGASGPNGLTNRFMVIWRGIFDQFNGNYRFTHGSDDGRDLEVTPNNSGTQQVSDTSDWSQKASYDGPEQSSAITLPSGNGNEITLAYFEDSGNARTELSFQKVNGPAVSLTASNVEPDYNTSVTLDWEYSDATNCTATPPITPGSYPDDSGLVSTGNLVADRTYTLSCNDGGDPVIATVFIDVKPPPSRGINVIKGGKGTVNSTNIAGIACGIDCDEEYPQDTSLQLTATPASGRVFVGWGGPCTSAGSNPICNFTVTSNETVYAYFVVDPNFKEF